MITNSSKYTPQWQNSIVNPNASLRDVLKQISESGTLITCVTEKNSNMILGIITDSDVRKALLRGASLDECILNHINRNPMTANDKMPKNELIELAYRTSKREIPLVNDNNEFQDIFVLGVHDQILPENEIQSSTHIKNYMFILAGGLGTRLKSVVNDRPKSLAIIGGKPILEIIIQFAERQGFRNFYISINYLAEQIETFLAQEKFSHLNINFIRESQKLGTAGSIGLVKAKIEDPIIVCNSDVLTHVDYQKVINYHIKNNADITCLVRPYQTQVPYGVANIQNNQIISIKEKPTLDFIVNAGMYVLSPKICEYINSEKYLDMPNFISEMIAIGNKVIPFMIFEYWIDVGAPEDYHKANNEYHLYFEG